MSRTRTLPCHLQLAISVRTTIPKNIFIILLFIRLVTLSHYNAFTAKVLDSLKYFIGLIGALIHIFSKILKEIC